MEYLIPESRSCEFCVKSVCKVGCSCYCPLLLVSWSPPGARCNGVMTILTNAACTRVKPGPTNTGLAFCFIPIANYSLLSIINQGTVLIKAKFILYENTLHKIVFTICRDTNYVFRWIFILFKCSRSFVDFIYIWDTKLVINLCKKLMNDNLYQSKAGVFTPGWFLWPPITIPSSRQIRIMMMYCNCKMGPCTSAVALL